MKQVPPSQRRAKARIKEIVTARSCGPCQECCDAVAVHEIGKDQYTRCEHQCSVGCAVYQVRPESCREYYCLWRLIGLPESQSFRPDQLRAIFDISDEKLDSKPYIRCWQLDAPDQILTDPDIRKAAYQVSITHKIPIIGYYKNNKRSVHLIRPLLIWRNAFEDKFPQYPVYELTETITEIRS